MEDPTRCSRCILPDSLPGVNLDTQGICNYCHEYDSQFGRRPQKSPEELKKDFERLVSKYRGRGKYDALVPISGGKDSMFVLYSSRSLFGLNVLAYNFDNGFQSPNAFQNIQRAVKTLGVDLIVFKPREDVLMELYRTFLKRAGELCTPCNMIIAAAAYRFAEHNGIRLILHGGSRKVFASVKGMSVSKYADRHYYLRLVDGQIDRKKIEPLIVESPWRLTIKQLLGKSPLNLEVLDYIYPGGEQMRHTLEKEVGWRPTSDELEHGDCYLNPLKDYLYNRKWGFSEITQAYSSRVRNGQISRAEALCLAEEEEVRSPPPILETFLKRINMTRKEFDRTVDRHFSEYPNYQNSVSYRTGKRILYFFRGKR